MKKKLLLLLLALATLGWADCYADEYIYGPQIACTVVDGQNVRVDGVYPDENGNVTIPYEFTATGTSTTYYVQQIGSGSNAIWKGGDYSIKYVEIYNGVTTISASAFYGITTLETVSFPESVTSIGNYAFQTCDALTSLTFDQSTAPTIGKDAFATSANPWYSTTCIVKVRDGLVSSYSDDSYCWAFSQIAALHHIHELSYPSITAVDYATYYNTYGYTMPDGVEGYLINWTYNGTANLVKVYDAGDKVCPGIALLWKSTTDLAEETWFTVEAYASGDDSAASWPTDESSSYNNLLAGSQSSATTTAWGTESSDYYYYKLAKDDTNGLGWYWGASEGAAFTSTAHKAWLLISKSSGARSFISLFDDETTGVETVNREPLTVNQYYDLQGRRVAQPTKGLYIVNGKKVIIK